MPMVNVNRFVGFLVCVSMISVMAVSQGMAATKSEKEIPISDDSPISAKLVVDPIASEASSSEGSALPDASSSGKEAGAKENELKPAEVVKLPESQIPVLTSVKEEKKASSGSFGKVIMSLGVLLVGLLAALFGVKRYAKQKDKNAPGASIRVMTTHSLGPKKNLAIIQVAGEAILIGVTEHNISMIKTLALIDDEIPNQSPRTFDTALDEYEQEVEGPSRGGGRFSVQGANGEPEDDFTVRGLSEIRDKVSMRLKGMKNY